MEVAIIVIATLALICLFLLFLYTLVPEEINEDFRGIWQFLKRKRNLKGNSYEK